MKILTSEQKIKFIKSIVIRFLPSILFFYFYRNKASKLNRIIDQSHVHGNSSITSQFCRYFRLFPGYLQRVMAVASIKSGIRPYAAAYAIVTKRKAADVALCLTRQRLSRQINFFRLTYAESTGK